MPPPETQGAHAQLFHHNLMQCLACSKNTVTAGEESQGKEAGMVRRG
jgi:hypothetical protein